MKAETYSGYSGAHLEVIAKAEAAGRAIPPLWPLSSSVAVNPFLGQTEQSLPQVAAPYFRFFGQFVIVLGIPEYSRASDRLVSGLCVP